MTDERLDPQLRSWLEDTELRPADVHQSTGRVMARVATAGQRGRWWPLPSLEPRARYGSSGGRSERRPIRDWPGPEPSKRFTLSSAIGFTVAAAIVVLFSGVLLSGLLSKQPSDESIPAAVTASPQRSPSAFEASPMADAGAVRVEVPEEHFAISFPAGWLTEVRPLDDAPDAPLRIRATSPTGDASCEAGYYGDFSGDEHMVPYMEPDWDAFMEQWVGTTVLGEDDWPEGASVEWEMPVPAGPTTRLTLPSRQLDTSYFTTDGFGVYEVSCGPSSTSADRWLSVAAALELTRAEHAPNGELISGPPLTSETLLSRFITEPVAPGVTWIVYDNENDLTGIAEGDVHILAAHDGSVWRYDWGAISPFGGLGVDWGGDPTQPHAVDVGRGNTIWAIRSAGGGPPELFTLDHVRFRKDEETIWTLRKKAPDHGSVDGVDVRPDDGVWAWWTEADGTTSIGRLAGDDWRTIATLEGTPAADGGEDEDDEDDEGGSSTWQRPAIAIRDGVIWALSGDPVRLLRHEGADWKEQVLPAGAEWTIRSGPAVGPRGEVWVGTETCRPDLEFEDWIVCTPGLARFDGDGWTGWDWETDPPPFRGVVDPEGSSITGVDPAGRLWLATSDGAVWFDGTDWGRYLPGLTIYASAVAPDGSVWVNAGEQRSIGGETDYGPTEYYVITPKADSDTQ